jgi:hypothetical protein
MTKTMTLLKVSYWWGIIADAVMAVLMLLALQDFAGYNKAICHALPTITQERSGTPHRSGHVG